MYFNESIYICICSIPTLFGKYDDTTTLPNLDCYFYKHIGHHLSKINDKNERVQYFRMIFLDFRFLEQKIRNDTTPWAARGSILHTLRTLKCYREQIAGKFDLRAHSLIFGIIIILYISYY